MLRELTEFILPSRRAPLDCEACGKPFLCGASLTGCWCFGIKLSAETRQQLRVRYRNCLCRDCLTRLADGEHSDAGDNL
ncbi:MAG TPA: cysteine-rich CWC family protein [Blastocatellia bacterium]|jgi:hypothetical protein